MNKIILIGRITKDIEYRVTQNNVKIASYSIAVNRHFKNSEGVYETDFFNCTTFGNMAENIKEYVNKGDLLMCEGRLQNRSYENKEGKKVNTNDLIIDKVEFLAQSRKPKEEKVESEQVTYKAEEIDNMTTANDPFGNINSDDLPF